MINDIIMSNNGFGWKKAAAVVDAAGEGSRLSWRRAAGQAAMVVDTLVDEITSRSHSGSFALII